MVIPIASRPFTVAHWSVHQMRSTATPCPSRPKVNMTPSRKIPWVMWQGAQPFVWSTNWSATMVQLGTLLKDASMPWINLYQQMRRAFAHILGGFKTTPCSGSDSVFQGLDCTSSGILCEIERDMPVRCKCQAVQMDRWLGLWRGLELKSWLASTYWNIAANQPTNFLVGYWNILNSFACFVCLSQQTLGRRVLRWGENELPNLEIWTSFQGLFAIISSQKDISAIICLDPRFWNDHLSFCTHNHNFVQFWIILYQKIPGSLNWMPLAPRSGALQKLRLARWPAPTPNGGVPGQKA